MWQTKIIEIDFYHPLKKLFWNAFQKENYLKHQTLLQFFCSPINWIQTDQKHSKNNSNNKNMLGANFSDFYREPFL